MFVLVSGGDGGTMGVRTVVFESETMEDSLLQIKTISTKSRISSIFIIISLVIVNYSVMFHS